MDARQILKEELERLAKRIKNEVIVRLHGKDGINPKTGKNTLIGSKLEKSIGTYVSGEDTIVFEIADYYTYIVGGRKPGWGSPPPSGFVEGVKRWIREKNIHFKGKTENQVLFLVLKSIVEQGIYVRPFIGNGYYNDDPAFVLPFLDEFFDKWADNIFERITYELDKYFNQ